MEQSVRTARKKTVLFFAVLLLLHTGFAQTAPELVFRNPVLESGNAAQDGAVYRFGNITAGMDGLLKIKGRSGATVELADIDLPNLGWDKALQPQLGIRGNVPAAQTWWMEFELTFVKTGTTDKSKLKDFVVTSLDIDGDGVSIQEFVQMNKMKSMAYSSYTFLKTGTTLPGSLFGTSGSGISGSGDSYNLSGTDNMILGPVTNFTDIDTAATAVMATYTYEDKDAITFVIGATSGSAISNAGLRLNSLWFKSFSLAPQPKILPLTLQSFSTTYAGGAVTLSWKTASEKAFSHFVIERSVDGKSYSDIALVFGNGGTQENAYSYKDKSVAMPAGVAYYRLRMVDEDRTFSYSTVSAVHVKEGKNDALAVYPNPTANSISVGLPDAWRSKQVSLKLYNSTGVLKQNKDIKTAGASADLLLTNLPAGVYIVQAACNGKTAQRVVLKN